MHKINEASRRAALLAAEGKSKQEIFTDISTMVKRPFAAARIVTRLPNAKGFDKFRRLNIVTSILLLVLAVFNGIAKAVDTIVLLHNQMSDAEAYRAAMIIGCIYFLFFGSIAYEILRRKFHSYVIAQFLMMIVIVEALRSTLIDAGQPGLAGLFVTEIVIGLALPIVLLALTIKLRNNQFSRTSFFGKPLKNKDGSYEFRSTFETTFPGESATAV